MCKSFQRQLTEIVINAENSLSRKDTTQWSHLHGNRCLFMWGAYFCMGAYKRNVVVVIKMGAYIHGVLILCGCLLSRFYGTS